MDCIGIEQRLQDASGDMRIAERRRRLERKVLDAAKGWRFGKAGLGAAVETLMAFEVKHGEES